MADTTPVANAFSRISDVDVVLTLQKPTPQIGFGNMVILTVTPAAGASGTGGGVPNKATKTDGLLLSKTDTESGAVYNEYASIDAVELDYPSTTNVYAKASAYFAQKNPSDRVAVLSYPTGKLDVALKNFWFYNFYFAIFDTNNPADQATASNIFEANKNKFLFVQAESTDYFSAWEGNNYTVDLVHPLTEAMDAAFIGRCASETVGTITWKFKTLVGITAQDYTMAEFTGINQHHAIVYVNVADTDETSEGWTSSGEYIDNEHGDIWIKTMVQYNVQKDFQNNEKIPYEASGINLLSGTVFNTLQTAYDQGIILTDDTTKKGDFKVGASDRSAQSLADLSKRHYGGIQFWYHRAGAIHSATIYGVVKSDTATA